MEQADKIDGCSWGLEIMMWLCEVKVPRKPFKNCFGQFHIFERIDYLKVSGMNRQHD